MQRHQSSKQYLINAAVDKAVNSLKKELQEYVDKQLNNRCYVTEPVSSESAGLQTIIDDLREELSETRTALDAVTLDRNQYKRVKELAECQLWDEQDNKDDMQAQIKELTAINQELTNKVQHLMVQNEQQKEQFAHEKRRCELLYELINAQHVDEMSLNSDSDVEYDAPYADIVEKVLSQYKLQPAPRGYVMMNTTDLSGRWQSNTIAHFIRHICETHPEFSIEITARRICKQLIHNDVAECSEYYIIRG